MADVVKQQIHDVTDRAIPNRYMNNFRRVSEKNTSLQEVLIFGDDDKAVVLRIIPDSDIVIVIHSQMHDVKRTGELFRKRR